MLDRIWGFLLDVIIAIFVMFIAVFLYFGLRTDTVVTTMGKEATKEFATEAKRNGAITVEEYEKYISKLSSTNALYDISLQHTYTIREPEYRMRTLQEIIDAQKAAYTGSNIYTYRDVTTEVPIVEDPVNTGALNTETNASVMAAAKNTAVSSDHVHTDACYTGHRHLGSANATFTHYHTHAGGCNEYLAAHYFYETCANCGKQYLYHTITWYWDYNLNTTVCAGEITQDKCPNCGSKGIVPGSEVSKAAYAYSCGYNLDLDGDGFTDRVGYTNQYAYQKAYPQDTGYAQTITNGCYTYHVHAYSPHRSVSFSTGYISYFDVVSDIYALGEHGDNAYCGFAASFTLNVNMSPISVGNNYNMHFETSVVNGKPIFNLKWIRDEITYIDPNTGKWVRWWDSALQNLSLSKTSFTAKELYTMVKGNTSEYLYNLCTDRATGSLGAYLYEYAVMASNYYYGYTYPSFVDGDMCKHVIADGEVSLCSITTANTWYPTCGEAGDTSPDCGAIITGIVPTHPIQKVAIGDPLITTITITHADGSTTTQIGTCNFSTAAACSNQTATITYQYTIDGVTYSKSCNITVTVVRRTKTCPDGHVYNLNPDGSDPGCPYSRAWVRTLQLIKPGSTDFTITIGTTLEKNGVTLLVTYMDGHTETITSGYVDNLDMNYLGTMQVTIGYKGVTMQCRVTTVCAKMICPICGYEYDLNPDGSDPGCPRGASTIPVFTGNIMEYKKSEDTDAILETLYKDGIYRFNINDSFTISVKSKSKSVSRSALKKIFASITDDWFSYKKSEKIWSE